MAQQFNLSATKYGVTNPLKGVRYNLLNPIYNAYKENTPVNIRMLVKSLTHPTQITNDNFTVNEQNLLRDAYINSRYRASSPSADHYKQVYNSYNGMADKAIVPNPFNPYEKPVKVSDARDWTSQVFSPNIQYDDYQHGRQKVPVKFDTMNNAQMLKESFTNPAYAMAMALGRIYTDDNNNVKLNDTYDFKPTVNKTSKDYEALHKFAERYSSKMPVSIDLGNPSLPRWGY